MSGALRGIALLALIAICVAEEFCGVGEEYTSCGTACPTTCDNYGKRVICTLQCVPGCFCKTGLVRDRNGACVPVEACPQVADCGTGEVFQSCGTACPKTCDNFDKNVICTKQCVQGCFCKEGLVRNDEGSCVSPSSCDRTDVCGENESYQECGRPCEKCSQRLGACVAMCDKPGCYCKPGFFRTQYGNCIRETLCAKFD